MSKPLDRDMAGIDRDIPSNDRDIPCIDRDIPAIDRDMANTSENLSLAQLLSHNMGSNSEVEQISNVLSKAHGFCKLQACSPHYSLGVCARCRNNPWQQYEQVTIYGQGNT